MSLKLIIFLVALCSISGYTALPQRSHLHREKQSSLYETQSLVFSKTMLKYRESQVEDSAYVVETVVLNKLNASPEPAITAFLPRISQELEEEENLDQLLDLEIIAGRFAMVAAVILFCAEVSNGKSIPEQILGLFLP